MWPAPPEQGALEAVAAGVGPRCQRNVALGSRTTYQVGGRAALFLEATSIEELVGLAPVLAGTGVAVLVLGRGSNLLVADAGFPGLVVTLSREAFGTINIAAGDQATDDAAEDRASSDRAASGGAVSDQAGGDRANGDHNGRGSHRVLAGGAVPLPVLARQSAAAGLTGMEWGVGVPGSVGGAVRMNAGGHGADTRATLLRCRLVDLRSGQADVVANEEMGFGFRRSAVAAHQVVVEAEYRLWQGDRAASEATIRDILRWRREHQPGGQNAGSVFINPLGDPSGHSAGWLVDAAGLKGRRHGSAVVSTKHANFIQAEPEGSADDVVALMLEVQQLVSERLGVELRTEVRLLGFAQHLLSTLGSRTPGSAAYGPSGGTEDEGGTSPP